MEMDEAKKPCAELAKECSKILDNKISKGIVDIYAVKLNVGKSTFWSSYEDTSDDRYSPHPLNDLYER